MKLTARQLRQLIKEKISKLREAVDTDGDGTPDYRDLDSDNDGISDREEATPKASALLLDWVDNYIDFYTLENLTKRKVKKTLRGIFDEMHPHPSLNNDKSKDVMLHYILVAIKKHEEESMDNPWDDDDDPADWLGPEGEYVQEVQRMKITAGQLRRIIREVLEEAKDDEWSGRVETKWHPAEGLFLKSASAIVKALKAAPDGEKKAMSRLNFYINRCGDDCPNRGALEKAKKMLKKKDD